MQPTRFNAGTPVTAFVDGSPVHDLLNLHDMEAFLLFMLFLNSG
jgi:hypothetical protein